MARRRKGIQADDRADHDGGDGGEREPDRPGLHRQAEPTPERQVDDFAREPHGDVGDGGQILPFDQAERRNQLPDKQEPEQTSDAEYRLSDTSKGLGGR